MRSIWYFIREAFTGFKNNFATVLGAIVTIYLSLLVIGIFATATMVIDQLVGSVESQVAISVFVRDDASEDDIWTMQSFIRTLPGVGEVTFMTKEEALERFKENSKPEIIEAIGENPLPASIEVAMLDPQEIETVATTIMSHQLYMQIIDEPENPSQSIRYGKEVVERLFSLTRVIRFVSLGLVALLIFVALIFINNTIRLAIFARRKEISIMRLVGASNGFIRGPFLMEGTFQALIGSGLAIATINFGIDNLATSVQLNIPWLMLNFAIIPMNLVYTLLLGIGLVIGFFGSGWAMRRYLKV
ncbi:MAG: permease-like cell division protein FtsX [Coriobacteriales bacterium]|jgi:cell division transport system permease protein|nr:permease-like cell division protein FtsX [Coriobacteriales bacterium]